MINDSRRKQGGDPTSNYLLLNEVYWLQLIYLNVFDAVNNVVDAAKEKVTYRSFLSGLKI